jgi:hypothetical protein
VRLRRRRFGDVIERQLEFFVDDDSDLLDDVARALERYNGADRDEAEERDASHSSGSSERAGGMTPGV